MIVVIFKRNNCVFLKFNARLSVRSTTRIIKAIIYFINFCEVNVGDCIILNPFAFTDDHCFELLNYSHHSSRKNRRMGKLQKMYIFSLTSTFHTNQISYKNYMVWINPSINPPTVPRVIIQNAYKRNQFEGKVYLCTLLKLWYQNCGGHICLGHL